MQVWRLQQPERNHQLPDASQAPPVWVQACPPLMLEPVAPSGGDTAAAAAGAAGGSSRQRQRRGQAQPEESKLSVHRLQWSKDDRRVRLPLCLPVLQGEEL